jgi:hypothetical protein
LKCNLCTATLRNRHEQEENDHRERLDKEEEEHRTRLKESTNIAAAAAAAGGEAGGESEDERRARIEAEDEVGLYKLNPADP